MQQSNSERRSQQKYYNSQEEDEEELKLFPDIQKMIFYLKQQQLAPALLPYRQELVNRLQTNLKQQQAKIKQFKTDTEYDTDISRRNYKTVIYSMEIQKISFILKHYLKIRFDKIQKCSFYYFKNMAIAESLMSKPELQFLKKYVDLRYQFYEKNIFKSMGKNFRGLGGMELFLNRPEETKFVNTKQSNSQVIEPDMKSYVFVKMNRNPNQFRYKIDIPIFDIPSQDIYIAAPNEIFFIPYQVAKRLMDRSQQGDLILM